MLVVLAIAMELALLLSFPLSFLEKLVQALLVLIGLRRQCRQDGQRSDQPESCTRSHAIPRIPIAGSVIHCSDNRRNKSREKFPPCIAADRHRFMCNPFPLRPGLWPLMPY